MALHSTRILKTLSFEDVLRIWFVCHICPKRLREAYDEPMKGLGLLHHTLYMWWKVHYVLVFLWEITPFPRLVTNLLTVPCSSMLASGKQWRTWIGIVSSSTMWTTYQKMTATIMDVDRCQDTLQPSWINICICKHQCSPLVQLPLGSAAF